jgi:hypothetical protein
MPGKQIPLTNTPHRVERQKMFSRRRIMCKINSGNSQDLYYKLEWLRLLDRVRYNCLILGFLGTIIPVIILILKAEGFLEEVDDTLILAIWIGGLLPFLKFIGSPLTIREKASSVDSDKGPKGDFED